MGRQWAVVRRPVKAALLDLVGLPPPAPGALVLTRLRRSRAGRAADGCVAAVVQRVVGHLVFADVIPDLVLGPQRQRRDLAHARVLRIRRYDLRLRTRRRLLPAQTRDPGVVSPQRPRQRARLAHLAALAAELD